MDYYYRRCSFVKRLTLATIYRLLYACVCSAILLNVEFHEAINIECIVFSRGLSESQRRALLVIKCSYRGRTLLMLHYAKTFYGSLNIFKIVLSDPLGTLTQALAFQLTEIF